MTKFLYAHKTIDLNICLLTKDPEGPVNDARFVEGKFICGPFTMIQGMLLVLASISKEPSRQCGYVLQVKCEIFDYLLNKSLISQSLTYDLHHSTMTPRYFLLLFLLSIIAATTAIPVPDGEKETKSMGQDLGLEASTWISGGLAMIALVMGSVTYGTNWWHRFKTMQTEHEGNMTIRGATQARKEQEHQRHMEALDIILDVIRNYTENVGKGRKQLNMIHL